jgi:hypothetical protein
VFEVVSRIASWEDRDGEELLEASLSSVLIRMEVEGWISGSERILLLD